MFLKHLPIQNLTFLNHFSTQTRWGLFSQIVSSVPAGVWREG